MGIIQFSININNHETMNKNVLTKFPLKKQPGNYEQTCINKISINKNSDKYMNKHVL